ncbi:DUF2815 family protein [Alkaliphilus peptidifermentans]|uniref:DUF2815 family protein n=1 Tax=Alkaliphilus peptidifermentans DSM 18978 TaxID=1120976 RepID=A0A1G5EIR6_9FIRM|nr:DUF2815 family protein [Alkaliphilus peptidifermentans]SCY26338.1 Protein of unknown function [Alkaliphilus peptidifermentans DSM 18978]
MAKVIIGTKENPVRFSYANVFEPKSINGSDPKYSVSIIIPKTNSEAIKAIEKAIEEAKKDGIQRFGAKFTSGSNFKSPLRDGDTDRPEDETYEDSYFINANSKVKPGIVDRKLQPISNQTEFYSGCFGRVSINIFPYSAAGNKGLAAGLNNIQKTEDGESLGGKARAEDDFEALDGEDDDFLG